MENKYIKALCDYLLGYWEIELDWFDECVSESDEADNIFNDYFIDKYDVDLENELNIGPNSWKNAHIELSNLLDASNSELSRLLLEMKDNSIKNKENIERITTLMEDLYKKF